MSANAEAIFDRIRGEAASRPRAMLLSASAGIAVAAMTYRILRDPEQGDG